MTNKRYKAVAAITSIVLLIFISLFGYSVYSYFTDRQTIPTSLATSQPEPSKDVKNVSFNKDNELIILYQDGSSSNLGKVTGKPGTDGLTPTQGQLYAAWTEYCSNGACDGKQPTQAQLLEAVTTYCTSGVCKGVDGTNPSVEQMLATISAYCSTGVCKGSTGNSGTNGTNADTQVLSCVTRLVTAVPTHFVAWKYSLELDASYRDLYQLPTWAVCSNPINLTGV